jgi:acyl-CoA synthetase (NDP forming)
MATDKEGVETSFVGMGKAKGKVMHPREAESVLRNYGIKTARRFFCKNDLDEVLRSSEEIGFPIAVKLISPDILHKSDAGCVALNLGNREEVRRAYHGILENVGKAAPDALIEGFLVQEMVLNGHEVIVGLAHDPTFGKVILFGLGGIFVEILKDVAIRMLPISKTDAQDMIEEIKGYRVLQGARGREPANLQLLREILLGVSRLGTEVEQIREMDLNPIFVGSSRAIVADSRILVNN